jgi:hypothetical protein
MEQFVMSVDSLEQEIKELEGKLKPLLELKAARARQLGAEKSRMFIKNHGITKESVQLCDDDGMPWMGDVYKFGRWCKENSTKPWCCWNGLLYKTQEIIAGRMERNALGRYEDLPS